MPISTAIRDPINDLANHTTVLKQLKEAVEVAQRLRGAAGDSYVQVSELLNGGQWKLVNGVLTPTTVAAGAAVSITGGTGITATPSPITGTGTVGITNTAVTPGSYTNSNITVNAQGQITAASNGSGGTPTTLAAAILSDSPFAFWKCDDAGTKLADSSGNGFDLTTVNGTVAYQASPLIPTLPTTLFARVGALSGAVGNNGWGLTSQLGQTYPLTTWSGEFVVAPIQASATSYRIMDIRPNGGASSVFNPIITFSSGVPFLQFFYPTSVNNLSVPIPPGQPVHVVVTCSTVSGTSTVNVYVNGVALGTFSAAASTLTGTMVVNLGELPGVVGTPSFNIGYIALYASVLSVARIAAHAAAAGKLGV